MIKRISDMEIAFTITIHSAMSKWGDNPALDQTGATLHLSETYTVDDLDVYTWIQENMSIIATVVNYQSRVMRVTFNDLEDAMAFKLRWL